MHARAGAGVFLIPGVVRRVFVCVCACACVSLWLYAGNRIAILCREGHLEMSLAVRDWRLAQGETLLAASSNESVLEKLEPSFRMRARPLQKRHSSPTFAVAPPFVHRQQPAESGNKVSTHVNRFRDDQPLAPYNSQKKDGSSP